MRTLEIGLVLGAAIVIPACASTDETTRQSSDPIVDGAPLDKYPQHYPEAVLIDMNKPGETNFGWVCSGSLISPHVVLTAGHCVAGYSEFRVKAPGAPGVPVVRSTRGVTDYADRVDGSTNPDKKDVGAILLPEPIVLPAYPTLAAQPLPAGALIQNMGRIKDDQAGQPGHGALNGGTISDTQLFIGRPVAVRSAAEIGFNFDYLTERTIQQGDSGGPCVVLGTHEIVAVNSGGGRDIQVLARVDLVRDFAMSLIAQAGDAVNAPVSGWFDVHRSWDGLDHDLAYPGFTPRGTIEGRVFRAFRPAPGSPAPGGMTALFDCRQGNDNFASTNPSCPDRKEIGLIYTAPGDGRVPIYDCLLTTPEIPGDHFVSESPECERQKPLGVLGYYER